MTTNRIEKYLKAMPPAAPPEPTEAAEPINLEEMVRDYIATRIEGMFDALPGELDHLMFAAGMVGKIQTIELTLNPHVEPIEIKIHERKPA